MRWLAIPAALALIAATPATSPPPPTAEHQGLSKEQQQKGEQETPGDAPAASTTTTIERCPGQAGSDKPTSKHPRAERPWYKDPNWFIFITGALYAIVATGQLLAIRRQADTSDEQLGEMRRQADAAARQVAAMEQQAGIIDSTLRETAKTATATQASVENVRALERPWLVAEITDTNIWKIDWERVPFDVLADVEWSVRNAGRSPAFITGIWQDLGLLPADLSHATPPIPGPVNEMLIRVDKDHGVRRLLPLNPDVLDKLRRRAACIAVWGIVQYRDVWNAPHETRYCLRWFLWKRPDNRYSPQFEPVAESKDWTDHT